MDNGKTLFAGILNCLNEWDLKHPYLFSFTFSLIVVLYALIRTPSLDVIDENLTPTDLIQFVKIEEMQAPKRIVKKEITVEDSTDVSEDTSNVERAVGTSDDADAVDISFFPNIAPPKPIGRLKKLYPDSGKEMNIEAVVNVELLIASNGRVRNVKILGVVLTKALPSAIHSKIAGDFARDALKILRGARFSPPVVNGKRVPIKMEMPLKFRLT